VSDHAFATLLQQLSDPDAKVRLATLEKLDNSELSNTEQVSLLTGCLLDSDARIRAHAALRLGSFRATAIEAIPALKQLAESESDDLVRARVKDALYNIRMYDYSPLMRDL
jgi:HEAT repeat protein